MRRIFGKESVVENHSRKHAQLVFECVKRLEDLMESFYQNDMNSFDEKVVEISQLEHKADIIRRTMEFEFYKGAFLPFDREDRIILAELVDSVADMTKEAAYGIQLSSVKFPSIFQSDFIELIEGVKKGVLVLKECIEMLDVDLGMAITKAHEIEEIEERVDETERMIIKKLYESYRNNEFDLLTLLELRETVRRLGNIVDRAEDASDRVLIIVAKRKG